MKNLDSCLPDAERAALPAGIALSRVPRPIEEKMESFQKSKRLRFVTLAAKVANAFEFLMFAALKPADLTRWNRKHFEHFAGPASSDCLPEAFSLNEDEKNVVARHFREPGRALVLGCGQGREAIGLAKLGWGA